MSDLLAPVCSIAPTRRRRFLWAAWWSGPPTAEPFRKPDAFEGGARTREGALVAAERAAGARLAVIEPRWARAWARILVGEPPWPEHAASATPRPPTAPRDPAGASIWSILGLGPHASEAEIKQAFRSRALETHPDRGGDATAFHEVQRAYEAALRRQARPRRRGR